MSSLNLGALVQGLGVGAAQGQQLAGEARRIQRLDKQDARQDKQDQRADVQYDRQQKQQGDQDAYREKVKTALADIKPGDDYGAATKINDLVVEGSMVDPEGAKSLLPMAQIHMQRHLENTARQGVKAIETGDAQAMASLNEKFPGSKNIDKNEDGTYAASFDPATDSFNFQVDGKPTVVPRAEAVTMVQSMTQPEAALSSLAAQTKAQLKEVGDGLAQIKDGKITWLKEPSVKLTTVDNGGNNDLVDPKGNVVASFKKTAEPAKTVNHNGGAAGQDPAEVKSAQWLINNGVAKDAKAAWDLVKTSKASNPQEAIADITTKLLGGNNYAYKKDPGLAAQDAKKVYETINTPAASKPAAAGGVMPKGLPKGAKAIGTSKGKTVYESPDGKRFVED